MAYESPIKITYRQGIPEYRTFHEKIAGEITEHIESRITACVQDQMAIEINRGQLAQALKYDRDQYNKGYEEGYQDGYRAMINERTDPAEWIETDHKGTPYLCPKCQCFSNLRYYWCPWCGKDMRPEPIREAEETPDENQ